jgi:hypothetical protein
MSEEPLVSMFRLITGEDIVAEYEVSMHNNTTVYNFINPLKLITRRYPDGQIGILFTPWLPDEVLMPGVPSVIVSNRDILCIIHLRDKMTQFYNIYVQGHRQAMNTNNDILDGHLDTLIKTYKEHVNNHTKEPRHTQFESDEDEDSTTH